MRFRPMLSPCRAIKVTGVVVSPVTGRLMVKVLSSIIAVTTASGGMLGPKTGIPMVSEEVSRQVMVVEPYAKLSVRSVPIPEAAWLIVKLVLSLISVIFVGKGVVGMLGPV